MSTPTTRLLGLLVALTVTCVAGCTTGHEGSGVTSSSATSSAATPIVEQLHPPFSFVWSADAGIDIFSRPAELIRATQEALELTHIYGPDKTFPGYLKAIGGPKDPGDDPNYRFETTSQSTGGGWAEAYNSPMTNYFHITEVTISSEGRSIGAYVCRVSFASPDNVAFGPPQPIRGSVGAVTRFELSKIGPDRSQSGVDESPDVTDPAAEMPPTWDVFEGWRIDKIDQLLPGREFPPGCGDWFQQKLPFLIRVGNKVRAPAGNDSLYLPRQPVQPQFPEWVKSNQP